MATYSNEELESGECWACDRVFVSRQDHIKHDCNPADLTKYLDQVTRFRSKHGLCYH